MDFGQVKEIINMIDKSSITELSLGFENTKIKISKHNNIGLSTSQAYTNKTVSSVIKETEVEEIAVQPVVQNEPITIMPTETVVKKEGNIVKSPLVGTFYESSNPDKPAYVSVGSKVKKGDVLAIVEAMKIMNEITSQFDGEIAEILVKNEEAVEYGQDLFRIV